MTHTATPWRTKDKDTLVILRDEDFPPEAVARVYPGTPAEANAAFIVKACNRDHLFEELRNSLMDVVDYLSEGAYGRSAYVIEAQAVLDKAQEA